MNNELYDARSVGEGGIPAVALAGAPDSFAPAPTLVLAVAVGACCAGTTAAAGSAVVDGDFSVVAGSEAAAADDAGPWVDKKGLEDENWMPP